MAAINLRSRESMNTENTIREFFENHPGITAVYLYGSTVTGKIHPESDIDIGVLFCYDQTPSISKLLDLQANLSERLEREVDLVCLNDASPILQKQVISKGKLMLVKDQHRLNQFGMRVFTDYVDLKITRQHIEKYLLDRRILDG